MVEAALELSDQLLGGPSRGWLRSPTTFLMRSAALGPHLSISLSRALCESTTSTWMSPSALEQSLDERAADEPVAPVTKYVIAILFPCRPQAWG